MIKSIPLAILLLLFVNCKTEKAKESGSLFQSRMQLQKVSKPAIMAHRGRLNRNAPENSIQSFEEIHQFSKDLLIEFDVRITKDSVYVLLHDETLGRTTTGKGLLNEKSYEELKKIRLLNEADEPMNLEIPTFKDALQWASGKNFIVIDAKPECKVKEIADIVGEMGLENNSMVVCYSIKDALEYQSINPKLILAVGFNSKEDLESIKNSELSLSNLVALTPTSLQDESFYEQIEKMGVPIAYGTYSTLDEKPFDSVKAIYEQHAAQFDIITTDRSKQVYDFFMEKN